MLLIFKWNQALENTYVRNSFEKDQMLIYVNYAWEFSFNIFIYTQVLIRFAVSPQIHLSLFFCALWK